jgi:alkaline phosphatase
MRSEIAKQLAASNADVMLGFWRGWFLPKSKGGEREDGRDLIAELRGSGYDIAFTRDQLLSSEGDRLVGLFDDGPEAPSLTQMVTAALDRLGDDPDGFFLIVEAARIDWKSHDNDPAGAVLDTLAFDEAIAAAVAFAQRRGRTLVVVTADHETGGITVEERGKAHCLGSVTAPSAAIAAAFDPDGGNIAQVMAQRAGIKDLSPAELAKLQAEPTADTVAAVLSERAGLSWTTGGHTAARVPIYAFGPGAERFAGELDNTDIPKRLADAIAIGPFPPR